MRPVTEKKVVVFDIDDTLVPHIGSEDVKALFDEFNQNGISAKDLALFLKKQGSNECVSAVNFFYKFNLLLQSPEESFFATTMLTPAFYNQSAEDKVVDVSMMSCDIAQEREVVIKAISAQWYTTKIVSNIVRYAGWQEFVCGNKGDVTFAVCSNTKHHLVVHLLLAAMADFKQDVWQQDLVLLGEGSSESKNLRLIHISETVRSQSAEAPVRLMLVDDTFQNIASAGELDRADSVLAQCNVRVAPYFFEGSQPCADALSGLDDLMRKVLGEREPAPAAPVRVLLRGAMPRNPLLARRKRVRRRVPVGGPRVSQQIVAQHHAAPVGGVASNSTKSVAMRLAGDGAQSAVAIPCFFGASAAGSEMVLGASKANKRARLEAGVGSSKGAPGTIAEGPKSQEKKSGAFGPSVTMG